MEKSVKKHTCYTCDNCTFSCVRKTDWHRHIATPKHQKLMFVNEELIEKAPEKFICNFCDKTYRSSVGLWKHKKKCCVDPADAISKDNNVIGLLINENKDFKNIILELVKSNTELQKQMVDVCKNIQPGTINNNNGNTTNSHNKTFNLQIFLNEQCKDAMNMSDFVNTFDMQLSDLECVGELGYVEGITKIMMDKLNALDIYKRPIHCSDAKREILYVKDEDKWEKEEKHNPKLRKAIKTVSFKNIKLITKWSDTYPESKSIESRLNDKYMKLIKQSTGGDGDDTDNENKIIRRIAKEVIIDK